MPVDIQTAISSDVLFAALRGIDLSVPGRTEGRTTHHTETWTICRLLSTLAAADFLTFPLSVTHRDRPDFLIQDGDTTIGVEVTEEREFASKLDERPDIKLFVKLPGWFEIDTPVGRYNPDWAILKHDGLALYLVRETKGTRDFLKLRTTEGDKVRCGQRHFEAIGVPFDVVVSADEV